LHRDNGFNQGAVTLKYANYTLTQDRGRTFQLDSMDVDESNFVATAGACSGTPGPGDASRDAKGARRTQGKKHGPGFACCGKESRC